MAVDAIVVVVVVAGVAIVPVAAVTCEAAVFPSLALLKYMRRMAVADDDDVDVVVVGISVSELLELVGGLRVRLLTILSPLPIGRMPSSAFIAIAAVAAIADVFDVVVVEVVVAVAAAATVVVFFDVFISPDLADFSRFVFISFDLAVFLQIWLFFSSFVFSPVFIDSCP